MEDRRTRVLDLDVGPGANRMHAVARGRKIRSQVYRDWIRHQERRIMEQSVQSRKFGKGKSLAVTILVNVNRRRDIDNVIKPTLDLLEGAGVMEDDRWVDFLVVRRVGKSRVKADQMRVIVEELQDE